jgi:lysophospholipase L1-like esterase
MSKPWIATTLLALACASAGDVVAPDPIIPGPPPPIAGDGMRLLFVGNSLTYTNNVPSLVRQLAVAAGRPTPVVVSRTAGNAGLEDHWLQGVVRADLKNGDYDVMIMQQGPSTLAASGENLTHWTRIFAAEAVKYGTRPGLYAVSAPVGGNYDGGMENYRAAAEATQSAFYPASLAWKLAWDQRPQLGFYGQDGFHPSATGALMSAMVIAAVIFEIDPMTMPNLMPTTITESDFAVMRTAAKNAVAAAGRK